MYEEIDFMTFVIKNREGQSVFFTEDVSCIPEIDILESMKAVGCYFYYNKIRISIRHLQEALKSE